MGKRKARIQLSEHFTYNKLIRFVMPSVVMLIFTSVYGIVDGIFVSNFVGKTSFAALNLIWPLIMMLGALGFMIGTGGTAIVAKTLGQGEKEKAKQYFTMLVLVTLAGGTVLAALGFVLIEPVAVLLGAQGDMLGYCIDYGRILLAVLPLNMIQIVFQSFFVTAEKPKLGLAVTVAAGAANMVLDALFVAVFHWGLKGAAFATALSQCVGGIFPLIYFARKNDSLLRFTKTRFYGKVLIKTCGNGLSELLSNISASLVGTLFNIQLMRLAGENGVSAYGALMYVSFLFAAAFFGYSVGCSPIISYHYGSDNTEELKGIFSKSVRIVGIAGVVMAVVSFITAEPLSYVFVGYDSELYDMTVRGFRIYAFTFLFSGLSVFGSALFTALNNGVISAIISFLRTLVFQVTFVLLLPMIWELDGIWLSMVAAELLAFIVTVWFVFRNRKRYKYI